MTSNNELGHLYTVFPVEVFENIIDHLWDQQDALKTCSLVCKSWYPRSRLHLLGEVWLYDRKQVARLSKLVRENPLYADRVRSIVIKGGKDASERLPIPHMAAFAAMLTRHLQRVEYIGIAVAEWRVPSPSQAIFLRLAEFASVSILDLCYVTFPSVQAFGRLVFALPNVKHLTCKDVIVTRDDPFIPLPRSYRTPQTSLTKLDLDGGSMHTLIKFIVSSRLAINFKEIVLGEWFVVWIRDIESLNVQSLLQNAGAALAYVDLTLSAADMALDAISDVVGRNINLAHNSNLGEITLRLKIRSVQDVDFTWIPSILSHTSSCAIREISVCLDTRGAPDDVATPDVILDALDTTYCHEIDQILSTPRFSKLELFNLELWVSGDTAHFNGSEWQSKLSLLFPHLKRCLRAYISIHI